MKKTICSLSILSILLLPSLVSAAWWSPTSWFSKSSTQSIATTTTTSVSENVSLSSKISDLQKQLANLQSQLISCNQKVSSQANIKTQQVIATSTPQQVNTTLIKAINVKLAELDQADWELDNYTDEALIPVLNTLTTIEGKILLPSGLGGPGGGWYSGNIRQADHSLFHRVIQGYRNQLNIQLQQNQ